MSSTEQAINGLIAAQESVGAGYQQAREAVFTLEDIHGASQQVGAGIAALLSQVEGQCAQPADKASDYLSGANSNLEAATGQMSAAVGSSHPLPQTSASIRSQEVQQARGVTEEIRDTTGRLATALAMAAQEAELLQQLTGTRLAEDARDRTDKLYQDIADTILAMRSAIDKEKPQ